MIELPEAVALSRQIQETILGNKIVSVEVATPGLQMYEQMLLHKMITGSQNYGGYIEIQVEDIVILFNDGVSLRYHQKQDSRPRKPRLLITFADGCSLSVSVQLYGGLWCCKAEDFQNPYLTIAKEKPSPLTIEFNRLYFNNLISFPNVDKLSMKALLATNQRIPGLGNGILQDILFNAGLHPKRKTSTLSKYDWEKLYESVKGTIYQAAKMGGRDTEKDLFGRDGGYSTKLGKNTVDTPCLVCGTIIKKEVYMGGSIYYCSGCQPL